MERNLQVDINQIVIQPIESKIYRDQFHVSIDVLRLDQVHPIISGNKYFKLMPWLQDAVQKKAAHIGSFGGAYSNHLVATAFACKEMRIPFTGIIRGEQPEKLSATLQDAIAFGMQPVYVSRKEYQDKEKIKLKYPSIFWIDEGGYGMAGAQGAAGIFSCIPNASAYDYFICAVGTGTMMAGLLNATAIHQQVIGISVMKNNFSLEENIRQLLLPGKRNRKILLQHGFHFGGYAKHPLVLINFINQIWNDHALPLDIVYTGKTFNALDNLIKENFFRKRSRIIFIHSGGLQGNRSLPKNTLPF